MTTSKLLDPHPKYVLGMISYEIDMLRFCLGKLSDRPPTWGQNDERVHLEGFLLHYRNLIRFFSGNNHNCKKGDVSMEHPEAFCKALMEKREKNAEWYKSNVKSLDETGDDKCDHRLISKLLQHCTEDRVRVLGHEWPVSRMYEKLQPVLQAFEKDCLKRADATSTFLLGEISNSTATRGPAFTIGSNLPFGRRD